MQGHVAMNAVAALAANTSYDYVKPFVEDLWEQNKTQNLPTGEYRYYNAMLHMLGILHVSGNYKIYRPAANTGDNDTDGDTDTDSDTDNQSDNAGCQLYTGNARTEIDLSSSTCLTFSGGLSNRTLQFWDSDTNKSCDFRGTVSASNGAGSITINSNYKKFTSFSGDTLNFAASNGCKYVKVRRY